MAHAIRNEQVKSTAPQIKARALSLVAVNKSSKQAVQLKLKPRAKIPCHRLPFVGRSSPEQPFSFWHVPLTGGYGGGCETGNYLAAFLLIHLREQSRDEMVITTLGSIAGGWLKAAQTATPSEFDALSGQVIGFMTKLSPWLIAAADQLGKNLEKIDPKELLKKANAGLKAEVAL